MSNSCPICFEDLNAKSRASPDVCDHIFCLPCLEKWSKHGSFCPVDRKRFKKIINLDSETVIQIKPLKPKQQRVLYDVTVYCEVCKKHNNAGTLLLCDCCDLGYHCKCLTPPLKEVPPGQWYCPVCAAVEVRINTSKGSKKEVQHMVEDNRKTKDTHNKTHNSGNNSQTNIARNDGCNIPESSLKYTVSTILKNEKHIDYCQKQQDVQMTISTNQSNIEHAFFAAQSSTTRSITGIQNKKEQYAENETGLTLLSRKDDRKLRNCIRETKDLEDNTPETQISIARSVSVMNRKEHTITKKESVPNGSSNADNRNWGDCDVDIIDIEDDSSTVQSSIARNEKNIHSRKEQHTKKETESIGLSSTNDRRLKDCLIETIDLGDDYPAIQNNIARCIQNIKEHHMEKELTDLSKQVNRNLKNCQVETINIEDKSAMSLGNFTISDTSNQNIIEENFETLIAPTSIKKINETKLKNSQGEKIYVASVSHDNTSRSNKKSFNKLKHNKIEIMLDSYLKKDTSNCRSLHRQTIDIGSYSTESQNNTAKSEGSLHESQEDSIINKKDVLSSLRTNIKRSTRDQHGEAMVFKNKHSSISRNESIVHNNQKHSKKINELITLSKKKEKISKHYHGESKGVTDLVSPVFQTNIAISEKSSPRSHDERNKKNDAQTYLINLNNSLVIEAEQNSKVRFNSCRNLNISPEKNKVESQSKSLGNWYLEKKQKKISCKDNGRIGQQEVLMKNMSLLDSSPLNTALSCHDQISAKIIQSTNTPGNNSCAINISTKDDFKRNVASPQFSVFETLEDTFISNQKYLNINKAVQEMDHTTTNAFPLFSKNFPTPKKSNPISTENMNFLLKTFNSRENFGKKCNLKKASDFIRDPSQNYNVRQVKYAIKAKMNLAEELKKIENEKWTRSWKKHKHPRSSPSAVPEKLQKNLFNYPSASVSKQQ